MAMTHALALVVASALLQEPAASNAGQELIQKVIHRAKEAKSIRISATSAMPDHPQGPRGATLDLQLRGEGEFRAVMNQDAHVMRLKSDGKSMLTSGRMQVDPKELKLDEIMKRLRYRAAVSASLALDFLDPAVLGAGLPEIENVKLEGEEKVGNATLKIVSYDLPFSRGRSIAFRAWIDPEKLTVHKREARMGPMVLTETVEVMEYDAAFTDEFSMQSKSELRRAMELMASQSAELYSLCMGKAAARPEDLGTKPGAGFWPEGGFWIGGKKPAAFGRGIAKPAAHPLAAPTDRLSKLFSAHVKVRLLKAAADAYEAAYWMLPPDLASLSRKPMDVDVWPEGGFVGDESAFKDPWGRPFELVVRKGAAVIRGSKEGTVLESDLTDDERRLLKESGARWNGFLGAPRGVTYNEGPGRPLTNETGMKQSLTFIKEAQTDMRTKDLDKDGKPNYWTKDVAGVLAEGRPALTPPWLTLAKADVSPSRGAYPALKDFPEPEPFYGAYLLSSLKHFVDGDGSRKPFDDGTGRHMERYGIVAYPEVYGVSARLTFILSETGQWSKDLEGGEINVLPKDPEAEGWIRIP